VVSLETEHRGYKIRYGENSDEWYSSDAGDNMTAPTLSALKTKIDRMIAKQKKNTAIDAMVLDVSLSVISNEKTTAINAKLTAYVGPELAKRGGISSGQQVTGHKVETIYVATRWGKADERPARRVISLSNCCPIGPATDAAIEEANRLGEIAKQAVQQHRKAIDAIPRLTLDQIEALVKISGIDPTGGLK